MLLSRFWYVFLGLLLGAALFVLNLAAGMYNRAGARAMGEALSSDSQVVGWYLKDDARTRSGHLIKFALNPDIAKFLNTASKSEKKVPEQAKDKITAALLAVNKTIPKDQSFDAVFAVDQLGRVVAHLGYEQANGLEDFELGGYPVVADALHGYIRDDTLVWGRLYRVVARPVEGVLGSQPAGAIVGVRIMDNRFASELSERTGAAITFYANGQSMSAAAPEGFEKSNLDQITSDLPDLKSDKDYQEKGRSQVRLVGEMMGVQYSRLPGEAYRIGAGYAVGRLPTHVDGPFSFFDQADDKDKAQANILNAILIALGAAFLGLAFSLLEHTWPLRTFRIEANRLAAGQADQLMPSKFRGVYRKIASDLNDGVEMLAAKGGVPRRAADFKEVLGELPEQPQMSAFNFPGEGEAPGSAAGPGSAPMGPGSAAMGPGSAPQADSAGMQRALPKPPSRPRAPIPGQPRSEADVFSSEGADSSQTADSGAFEGFGGPPAEQAEWRQVYEQFVATKQQCGESVDGFTYQKFEQTLKKNTETLRSRHGAKMVKFSVYVKDGKAALKANPIRE